MRSGLPLCGTYRDQNNVPREKTNKVPRGTSKFPESLQNRKSTWKQVVSYMKKHGNILGAINKVEQEDDGQSSYHKKIEYFSNKASFQQSKTMTNNSKGTKKKCAKATMARCIPQTTSARWLRVLRQASWQTILCTLTTDQFEAVKESILGKVIEPGKKTHLLNVLKSPRWLALICVLYSLRPINCRKVYRWKPLTRQTCISQQNLGDVSPKQPGLFQ